MKYENITMKGDDTNVRYVLKKEGRNMLVVLGVNPSKATDKISDSTMTKVMGFAKYNGYDGFIMLNLYPQRCTNPNELDKEMNKELHQQNLKYIVSEINNMKSVSLLFAFGDTIARRHYLRNCLQDIISLIAPKNLHCLQIGELTKMGNPRHPSRAGYCTFLPFDVNKYLL
ncbi:MAG: DUF1643 domain-containing protein [Rikenellaceae bacterium]|nr:DUF1643 domain-containing protein [Rikenellaceae bacterium]